MKVSVRGDRFTIDAPSIGLIIAALDGAADSWLEAAAKAEVDAVRKSLLKMAGEAKALCILITAKQDEQEPAPNDEVPT